MFYNYNIITTSIFFFFFCDFSTMFSNSKALTIEQLRRDCMKFRKKVIAGFEENASDSTSIPVALISSKNKKKHKFKKKKSRENPCTNILISQVQVVEAKESTPKLIIRFSKTASDEATVSEGTQPLIVTPNLM